MALPHSPEVEKVLSEGDPVLREPIETISIALPHSPEEKELTEGDPVLRGRAGAY